MTTLTNEEWTAAMKSRMYKAGWSCDRDDDEKLWFSLVEGDKHWMKDYNKKTRSFVQFDGNQVVTLKVSK